MWQELSELMHLFDQTTDLYASDPPVSDDQGLADSSGRLADSVSGHLCYTAAAGYPWGNAGFETDHIGTVLAGDPEEAGAFWHMQEGTNSCAVACQTDILRSFGVDVSESDVTLLAVDRGYYDPFTGTSPEAMGKVLEAYGVPVTRSYDTSLVSMFDALEEGRRVVVALDANEIWHPVRTAGGEPLEWPDAGHAVWVTGFEKNDNGGLDVVLNDPGHPYGKGARVAMADFLNAWDDFGSMAVITDVSAGGSHVG